MPTSRRILPRRCEEEEHSCGARDVSSAFSSYFLSLFPSLFLGSRTSQIASAIPELERISSEIFLLERKVNAYLSFAIWDHSSRVPSLLFLSLSLSFSLSLSPLSPMVSFTSSQLALSLFRVWRREIHLSCWKGYLPLLALSFLHLSLTDDLGVALEDCVPKKQGRRAFSKGRGTRLARQSATFLPSFRPALTLFLPSVLSSTTSVSHLFPSRIASFFSFFLFRTLVERSSFKRT